MSIKFDAILGKIREDDAFSGSYNDLQDLPTLGTAAALNYGTSENNLPILDAQGKININVLPGVALTDTFVVASEAAMLALTAQTGDVAVRSDVNKTFILKGTSASTLGDWQELLTPTDSVHSVFGRQGTVTAQTNDYTWAQINKATSSLVDITTRNYSDLSGLPTLGTLSTQNGTFSGGGTVATGGFTLTVPATGTAALLGRANVFTEAQTIQKDLPLGIYNNTNTAQYGAFRFQENGVAAASIQQIGSTFATATRQNNLELFNHTATGQITFHTNAVTRMTITAAGLLGLGTQSPAQNLSIARGATVAGLATHSTVDQSGIQVYANSSDSFNRYTDIVAVGNQAGSYGGSIMRFLTSPNNSNTAVEAMRINQSGNIGIGTASPTKLLHLERNLDSFLDNVFLSNNSAGTSAANAITISNGTGSFAIGKLGTGATAWSGYGSAADSFFYSSSAGGGDLNFINAYASGKINFAAGGNMTSVDMTIASTGLVGIGTTAPATKFHVYDTASLVARFEANGANVFSGFQTQANSASIHLDAQTFGSGVSGTQFGVNRASTSSLFSDGSLLTFGTKTNHDLIIGTNNAERMRISNTGNVGIGTTSPTGELHIDQASTTAAIPTLILDQADVSEEFIEFVSTSAANNTNPISTTAVGTYAGKLRINVNGTYYWLPYYNP